MTAWLYALLVGLLVVDKHDKRRRQLERLDQERERLERMFRS